MQIDGYLAENIETATYHSEDTEVPSGTLLIVKALNLPYPVLVLLDDSDMDYLISDLQARRNQHRTWNPLRWIQRKLQERRYASEHTE